MGYSYYFEKRRKEEKDDSCIYDALVFFCPEKRMR